MKHVEQTYRGFRVCTACDTILCPANENESCNRKRKAGAKHYIDRLRSRPIASKTEAQVTQSLLKEAVEWIAHNDNAGAPDALDESAVEMYLTVYLVADLFGIRLQEVAEMVVGARKRAPVPCMGCGRPDDHNGKCVE